MGMGAMPGGSGGGMAGMGGGGGGMAGMMGGGGGGFGNGWTVHNASNGWIGPTRLKALYVAYTDATFSARAPRPAGELHRGFLGPLLRAEVWRYAFPVWAAYSTYGYPNVRAHRWATLSA